MALAMVKKDSLTLSENNECAWALTLWTHVKTRLEATALAIFRWRWDCNRCTITSNKCTTSEPTTRKRNEWVGCDRLTNCYKLGANIDLRMIDGGTIKLRNGYWPIDCRSIIAHALICCHFCTNARASCCSLYTSTIKRLVPAKGIWK